jgi:[acyl-carrier-protein] S-malonyltransferase
MKRKRSQFSFKFLRKFEIMKAAFVFPGQGAQAVGMGKDMYEAFPEAQGVFNAFEAIVPDLKAICFNGPEETLKRTLYTQPAILATSLACLKTFQAKTQLKPVVTAGHSLGEYGALVASGVLTVETAAQLIQKRAELMDQAKEGAMSAVLGLDGAQVEKIVAEVQASLSSGVVTVANYNTATQVVISGSPDAVAQAGEPLKAAGAKRVLPLPVGGAFHSPLMAEAAQTFKAFLGGFSFQDAVVPVVTNVDAERTMNGADFQAKLATQIDHSVRWTQSMERIVKDCGIDTVIEFGPGKVLTGMFKTVTSSTDLQLIQVSDGATLEAAIALVNASQCVTAQ